MIPKVIHYCWFGRGEKPLMIRLCLRSWHRVLPDYKIVEWNEDNVDLDSSPWLRNAYRSGKWAFVADYVRFWVLHREGGLYFDTDVFVKKPFDAFLSDRMFISWDYPIDTPFLCRMKLCTEDGTFLKNPDRPGRMWMCGMEVAVMGAEPRHPVIQDCLDFYDSFGDRDPREVYDASGIVCDDIMLSRLWRYGLKMRDDVDQTLSEGIKVYTPHVFGGSLKYREKGNYAVHVCSSTWREHVRYKRLKGLTKTLAVCWMSLTASLSFRNH